jgi:hypothetical protein
MTKGRCAYCGKIGLLTNEHVFPRFLYNIFPEHDSRYFDKFPQKGFYYQENYEPKIKDVCQKCNNTVLSQLDSYAADFIKKYCLKIVMKEPVKISYDFNLLIRWLLKTAYNSARILDSDKFLFEPLRVNILKGKNPDHTGFLIGLIRPSILTADEKEIIRQIVLNANIPNTIKAQYINLYNSGFLLHEFTRITNAQSRLPRTLVLKHIAIRSFSFMIVDYLDFADLVRLADSVNFKILLPEKKYCNLHFSIFDTMDMCLAHYEYNEKPYASKIDFIKE